MEVQTKKKVLDTLREELRAAGLDQPEEAARVRDAFGQHPVEPSEAVPMTLVLGLWEKFTKMVDTAPELTPQELEELLVCIKQIRYLIRDKMLEAAKILPHRPGGATPKLTAKQRKKASEVVGILMGQGDSYPEAVEKMAIRFNVSKKTIQRAWQETHRASKSRK